MTSSPGVPRMTATRDPHSGGSPELAVSGTRSSSTTHLLGGRGGARGRRRPRTAKTVALHDRDGYRLAVIPAGERLDVRRARDLLGASHHLRLATEEELRQAFPAFELGALPPFGTAPLPEVVDLRLLRRERVRCAAGEHRRSLLIAALDLLRVRHLRAPRRTGPARKLPSS